MRRATFLIALLLIVAACGDDAAEDGTTSTVGAGATTTVAPQSTTTTAPPTTTTTQVPTTTIDIGGFDDCPALSQAFAQAAVGGGFFGGAGLTTGVEFWQQLTAAAPSDIQEEMALFAGAYGQFVQIIIDLDIDLSDPATFASLDAATIAQIEQAAEALDTPELQAALDAIEAWFNNNCN